MIIQTSFILSGLVITLNRSTGHFSSFPISISFPVLFEHVLFALQLLLWVSVITGTRLCSIRFPAKCHNFFFFFFFSCVCSLIVAHHQKNETQRDDHNRRHLFVQLGCFVFALRFVNQTKWKQNKNKNVKLVCLSAFVGPHHLELYLGSNSNSSLFTRHLHIKMWLQTWPLSNESSDFFFILSASR